MSNTNQSIMPVAFIGHGSPMNALAKDQYSQTLNLLGQNLPKPTAILCVSAHWMTNGSYVTVARKPKTIHDFYGFPEALYQVQYPADGLPELAIKLITAFPNIHIRSDQEQWGLDHGTWSVLTHIYPNADIPVLQLSLDMSLPPSEHLQIGQMLQSLRKEGVLILGSGNIVHNLRNYSRDLHAPAYDWAVEFDIWSKEKIEQRDFQALATDYNKTLSGQLAVPSLDHYLPMLYILGASTPNDSLNWVYDEIQNSSIAMRSFTFG
ncbi:4,5-DOPA dioxygenase extradiol [Pseudobdellovibrio exovorus]|uniref:Extradiol ring-cleavage dioxygenase class III enzyme subunit B domain-containing protein n=1 Tax=Pseudobdellovibrio exovorus JSS TaxID=1184267 RepID=M4VAR9_9BACT|nr:4,5-DOPA dioxygenase extradiol [Pseudobdellovibrio exovorus]AGH95116.1 hypothetical protein A11Q_900 [Pseudobdellovibrio exovorus JSS]